eukprot:350320-Chlamydomonas_euryale.AAC.11
MCHSGEPLDCFCAGCRHAQTDSKAPISCGRSKRIAEKVDLIPRPQPSVLNPNPRSQTPALDPKPQPSAPIPNPQPRILTPPHGGSSEAPRGWIFRGAPWVGHQRRPIGGSSEAPSVSIIRAPSGWTSGGRSYPQTRSMRTRRLKIGVALMKPNATQPSSSTTFRRIHMRTRPPHPLTAPLFIYSYCREYRGCRYGGGVQGRSGVGSGCRAGDGGVLKGRGAHHQRHSHLAVSSPMTKSRLASRSGESSGLRRCAGRPRRRSFFSKLVPFLLAGPRGELSRPATARAAGNT